MEGTLQVPVSFISMRMLQGEFKHSRRQVCPDFSDMITEWKSTESSAASKLIIQRCITVLLVSKLSKSQLLVGKE